MGWGLGYVQRTGYCENAKKRSGVGEGQGGCERRIEVFVKIKKKNRGGVGDRVGGGGGSGWMWTKNKELKFL